MKKLFLTCAMLVATVALFAAKPTHWDKNVAAGIAKQAGETVTQEQKDKLFELISSKSTALWDATNGKTKSAIWKEIDAGVKAILTPEQFQTRQAALKADREAKAAAKAAK